MQVDWELAARIARSTGIDLVGTLLQLDLVWAEIAVAALAGSLFYGAIAYIERLVTFWHPSYRRA